MGKGNQVGVKLGLSRNLSENYFQRSPRSGLKMMLNGKSLVAKVAGTFLPHDLDIKFGPIRVRMLQICPFSWSPRGGDGNPRVYIREKTLGRERSPIPRILLLLGSRLGEENLSNTISITKGRRRLQGQPPPRRGCRGLPPPLRAAPLHQAPHHHDHEGVVLPRG